MNKCEQYCRTIQRLCNIEGGGLPAEYQQVEYIQSSGSQWINTNVLISSQLETHITGQITGGDYYNAIAGGRNHGTSNGRYIPYGIVGNTDQLRVTYGSYDTTTTVAKAKNVNTVIYNDSEHKMFANEVQIANFSSAAFDNGGSVSLFLFAMNYGSPQWYGKGRLYSVVLYNNTTGEKLGDFIPCYRKSDNKPGMYDLVTNTFFTNSGSGEFTVGPDI